ncbi:MAG TPA: phosphatidylinositol-specific phospholipase C1-like protein [Steroidobacteraceae bacterium]|nr:phosphatidylinositol-specific phospholipase C1-like protein [Steroidobacteraceae bacterium]
MRCAFAGLLILLYAQAHAECDLAAAQAPQDESCAGAWMDENLRVNDLLSVGTHNSYKSAIPDAEMAQLQARSKRAGIVLDYSHRTLAAQLDDGARQLELDVYYDPHGGRFADPLGPRLLGQKLDDAMTAELAKPGFKVMHIPDFDFRSSCTRFIGCLQTIKTWSEAHPEHIPILILINAKDDSPLGTSGAAIAKFDAAAFDALDAEVAAVFADEKLITPDQVQGKHATLREAVLAGGWPKLRDARGRVFFALDEAPDKVAMYRAKRQSLEGRRMFVNIEESSSAAAYITLNEPLQQAERIRAAVEAGFIVRTRADADTLEAREGKTERREAAFASGAQYVSTDYMQADPRFPGYTARLRGGVTTVCNPLRTQKKCGGRVVKQMPRER